MVRLVWVDWLGCSVSSCSCHRSLHHSFQYRTIDREKEFLGHLGTSSALEFFNMLVRVLSRFPIFTDVRCAMQPFIYKSYFCRPVFHWWALQKSSEYERNAWIAPTEEKRTPRVLRITTNKYDWLVLRRAILVLVMKYLRLTFRWAREIIVKHAWRRAARTVYQPIVVGPGRKEQGFLLIKGSFFGTILRPVLSHLNFLCESVKVFARGSVTEAFFPSVQTSTSVLRTRVLTT